MRKKEKDGRSTLTLEDSNLRKLYLYKRLCGYASLNALIGDIIKKEDLLSYLIDLHPDRAFNLTKEQIEQYETENKIVPIGTIVATYLKPKRKTLILPKDSDIEVVQRK